MHFDHEDPEIIWIDPESVPGGRGSYEMPFSSLEEGLSRVQPGQTIVLREGVYTGDCNIQISGTARNPIRIIADEKGKVVAKDACWFFYDTSDLIVSGVTFVDAPHGAVSVVGACSRNRFEHLRFINCGTKKETACTLYLGGAGGECNIVEHCSFEHAPHPQPEELTVANASIGLMIAQGNAEQGALIVNNLVRRNRFVNYGYGILVGGDEAVDMRCGHIIEYNTLRNCSREALVIKSGDTQVRGNIIEQCGGCAISLKSELDSVVEDNRISGSVCGIHVLGEGHTVANNCIAGCTNGAVHIGVRDVEHAGIARNCFVENNTFVNCSTAFSGCEDQVAGVVIDAGSTGLLQRNLIFGSGKPYVIMQAEEVLCDANMHTTRFIIKDNAAAGGCSLTKGVGKVDVSFADESKGNFENGSGFGARGWMLTPQGFDPDADDEVDGEEYREASIVQDEKGNVVIPGEEEDTDELKNYFNSFDAGEDQE